MYIVNRAVRTSLFLAVSRARRSLSCHSTRGGWTQQISRDALCVVRAPLLHWIWLRASRSKHEVVIILQKGEKHSYTVPSFPVVTAMIHEVSNRFWAITAPGK